MKRFNPGMVQRYQKGIGPTRMVLLLTTTGRKSGQPRTTPLQYEEIGGAYTVGSARGAQADWLRNLQADPHVQVQIGERCFSALAEAVTDPVRIADFFEARLKHPRMIGLLMRLEGLPLRHTRQELEEFSSNKAIAILRRFNP